MLLQWLRWSTWEWTNPAWWLGRPVIGASRPAASPVRSVFAAGRVGGQHCRCTYSDHDAATLGTRIGTRRITSRCWVDGDRLIEQFGPLGFVSRVELMAGKGLRLEPRTCQAVSVSPADADRRRRCGRGPGVPPRHACFGDARCVGRRARCSADIVGDAQCGRWPTHATVGRGSTPAHRKR